jgi:hypothetical protein
MSLEVLLIPLGIAAFAALKEARSTDLCEKCKATRIKDQDLLVAALESLGATSLTMADGRVTAQLPHGHVTFQRVGEAFLGRVDKANESATTAMLADVQSAAGAIAQRRSVESIQQRAAELGLILMTRQDEDGSVQLVFEQAS